MIRHNRYILCYKMGTSHMRTNGKQVVFLLWHTFISAHHISSDCCPLLLQFTEQHGALICCLCITAAVILNNARKFLEQKKNCKTQRNFRRTFCVVDWYCVVLNSHAYLRGFSYTDNLIPTVDFNTLKIRSINLRLSGHLNQALA